MIRFYVLRHWRSHRWLLASALFVAMFAGGYFVDHADHSYFAFALFVALIVGYDLRIARDRQTGFASFHANFAEDHADLLHRLCAALLLSAALMLIAFLIASAFWRDPRQAAFSIAFGSLELLLLLPLAFIAEIVLGIFVPLAPAVLLVFAVFAYRLTHNDPAVVLRQAGLDVVIHGQVTSLGAFARYAALRAAILSILGYAIWTFMRPRFRITSAHEHQHT